MVLEVQCISKGFGGVRALVDIDLEVRPDRLTALIGPNGSGKTTLFNIISGIYEPAGGEIRFGGATLTGKDSYQIAACGIARTFQNIRLSAGLTVLENVLVGAHCRTQAGFWSSVLHLGSALREQKAAVEKALWALELVGLSDQACDRAVSLPYGKKRLLEIARALASQPRLLLLDEPAAGMNESETNNLTTLIRRIHQELKIAVLLVEHDMRMVMGIADWIYVLDYGQRIAEGTPAEITANPRVIEAYLGQEVSHAAG